MTMPPRHDLMRRELGHAATQLFQRRGIKAVTLKDVAAEVGLSKPAVYHYFDTKDALIEYVFADWAETSLLPFREIAESGLGPEEKLRKFIHLQVQQVVSETDLYMLSLKEEDNLPEKIRENFRHTKRIADHLIREAIEEGQRTGIFLDVDAHIAEFALMGMCNWIWKWYDPAGPARPAAIASAFIRIMLGGLRADGSKVVAGPPEAIEHITEISRHAEALMDIIDGVAGGDETA